ncbi:BON domain-containing protein, partial [Paraburkholderia sp. Se-20369]|nr:BON domain-containing protein [Paraburkholderia sp. Se-20369]
ALCGMAPGAMAAGEANAASLPATIGAKIHDATITTRAKAALIGKEDVSSGDIHVTTRHGDVLLTGSVPDEQQRMTAVNLVKQIDGVQHVRDQLTIRAK